MAGPNSNPLDSMDLDALGLEAVAERKAEGGEQQVDGAVEDVAATDLEAQRVQARTDAAANRVREELEKMNF